MQWPLYKKTTKATNISNQINLQKKIRPVQMRIRTLFLNVYVQRVKTITSSVIPHSLKSNGGKKFKIDFNEEFVECVKKCKYKDYLAEILLAKA